MHVSEKTRQTREHDRHLQRKMTGISGAYTTELFTPLTWRDSLNYQICSGYTVLSAASLYGLK